MIPPSSLVILSGMDIDLPLRAFNEGFLKPRFARARKIIRLHPLPPLADLPSNPYTDTVTIQPGVNSPADRLSAGHNLVIVCWVEPCHRPFS